MTMKTIVTATTATGRTITSNGRLGFLFPGPPEISEKEEDVRIYITPKEVIPSL